MYRVTRSLDGGPLPPATARSPRIQPIFRRVPLDPKRLRLARPRPTIRPCWIPISTPRSAAPSSNLMGVSRYRFWLRELAAATLSLYGSPDWGPRPLISARQLHSPIHGRPTLSPSPLRRLVRLWASSTLILLRLDRTPSILMTSVSNPLLLPNLPLFEMP